MSISVNNGGNPTKNQITSPSGFSYDSSGDMTADGVYSYTYDAEYRIITASGMTGGPYCYTYDPNGMRMVKAHANGGSCTGTVSVDMIYWRNIAGQTIAETDGTGSTTNSAYKEYVFFGGRRIAQSNPSSGNVYYYFVDHLGSTRTITTASGSPCYEADFLPYGYENTPSGFTNTCSTNYKFTGYERDAETAYLASQGNDYAFARYYSSRLGRFMSGDPLEGNITDPQTLNRYAYVRNNPVNRIDPLGTDSEDPYFYYDDPGPGMCMGDGGFAGAGFGGGCGFFRAAPLPVFPSQKKPPKPQKPNTLNCFKNQAFPQAFGSNAQISSTRVINNGNPIGGHVNFSFQATFSGPQQQAAFNSVLEQNTLVPPGTRIGVTINGQSGFGLHVEQVLPVANATVPTANFIAHLDVGDPNLGLGGVLKHIFTDFFKGHLPGANLDPKCN